MRQKHTVFMAAIFGILALTGGCAHKPSLVGTWVGPHVLPGGQGTISSSITLRGDGTFTTTAGQGSGASGTYSVQGNTLTETFSSYTVNGQVQEIPAQAAVTQTGTYRLDGDTLTLTIGEDSSASTLTRQKD